MCKQKTKKVYKFLLQKRKKIIDVYTVKYIDSYNIEEKND